MLPSRDLWPEFIDTAPTLRAGETVNLAAELIDAQVAAGLGDRTAIVFRGTRLTYRDVQARVNQAGHALRSLGVSGGDRVVLRIPNRPEFITTWLAIQKIGAVAVSTMPMLKARELQYVATDCAPRLMIVAADLFDEAHAALAALSNPPRLVTAGPARILDVPSLDELADRASTDLAPYATPRDALAIIAYTSGSTGMPKGACHSPIDILSSVDAYNTLLAPTPDDVYSGHPTMAFTYGLGALLAFPLRAGASTVLTDTFTPQTLLDLVVRERVTMLFCAATTYRLLLQVPDLEKKYDFGSLRACISAGEPLPRPVYDEWIARTGVELLDSLGTTEMFHIFVCAQPGRVRPGATGEVLTGYEAKIVDDDFNELPRGTAGLLAVRGPTGCRYWNKPDRQREYVRQGWNVPNDICIQDADGYFYYQCRNDDLIICAGYNIAGPEVEAVLIEHPAVLESAVVASPDVTKGQVPKAFVVLKPGIEPTKALQEQLQDLVKRQLAPYKYPRKVEFVASLPKTETGKIRRTELRERERTACPGNGAPPS